MSDVEPPVADRLASQPTIELTRATLSGWVSTLGVIADLCDAEDPDAALAFVDALSEEIADHFGGAA